jgi:hypothetical protein
VTDESPQSGEEQFASLVAACDEALAAGSALSEISSEVPPELRQRLQRGVACMKLLHQDLPPPRSTGGNSRENAPVKPWLARGAPPAMFSPASLQRAKPG